MSFTLIAAVRYARLEYGSFILGDLIANTEIRISNVFCYEVSRWKKIKRYLVSFLRDEAVG